MCVFQTFFLPALRISTTFYLKAQHTNTETGELNFDKKLTVLLFFFFSFFNLRCLNTFNKTREVFPSFIL